MALDSFPVPSDGLNFGGSGGGPKLSNALSGNIGGAVSDAFAGFGALQSADLKAQGLGLQAQGIRIKVQGDLAEATNYDLAGALARENETYEERSIAIQQMQLDRQILSTTGGQQAGTAGAGLAASGSALDLLADSARQGALAKSVLAQQGQITEAGYEEQAKSYDTMSAATRAAAAGEMSIAAQTDELAAKTKSAGTLGAIGDFAGTAIKVAAAVAPLLL